MGKDSKIEWTDHTFNPWIGCQRVSEGCRNCYAERLMDQRFGRVRWGPNGTRERTSVSNWNQPLAWNREAEKSGRRHRVFCASLADVFEDRPEMVRWRFELVTLIVRTPHLDWLLLTKRPENVVRLWEQVDISGQWPENVWIGTSVEDQAAADKRIPELCRIPIKRRFLSMEPLLDPVDLHGSWALGGQWCHECGEFGWYNEDGLLCPRCARTGMTTHAQIGWVIVGGESGPDARPMSQAWVRSIRDQCQAARVPFFFKQWGEWLPFERKPDPVGGYYLASTGEKIDAEYVLRYGHRVYGNQGYLRVGKKEAGRVLDGRTWDEVPKQWAP